MAGTLNENIATAFTRVKSKCSKFTVADLTKLSRTSDEKSEELYAELPRTLYGRSEEFSAELLAPTDQCLYQQ